MISAVFSAGAAQASEPRTKKQKSVLDCLLGDDEEVELTVTVSGEVNAYLKNGQSAIKNICLHGGKAIAVDFLAF